MNEDHVPYWTRSGSLSKERLVAAVKKAGVSVDEALELGKA